jgi:hypothetical protein
MVGARLQLWALVALAFVAGIAGIYMAGVQRGIDRQRSKIDRARLDKIGQAKDIEDEIEILDDTGLSNRASKWLRNDDQR